MKMVFLKLSTLASCVIIADGNIQKQLCVDQSCRSHSYVKSISLVQSVSPVAESRKDAHQTQAGASGVQSANKYIAPGARQLQTQQELHAGVQDAHSRQGIPDKPKNLQTYKPANVLLEEKPKGRVDVTEDEWVKWRAVTILSVLMFLAISPVLYTEGRTVFAAVVLYLACLTLVKIWVKEAMRAGLTCPNSMTSIHMISTAAVAFILERPSKKEALAVLPISLVNGCALLLNNTSLLYGGVAFVSMIGCTCPIFTFVLEIARSKRSIEFGSFSAVLLVVLGAMLCVEGEHAAGIISFFLSAGASFFRATKSVWQQDLLTVKVSPLRLVFWSGFWSFLLMVPVVLVTEGTKGITEFANLSNQGRTSFLLSVVAACTLNISQCFAVKLLGAVMQSVVGNLNLILIITLSQILLHESVSMWQYAGVVLLVAGTVLKKTVPKKDTTLAEKAIARGNYRSAGG